MVIYEFDNENLAIAYAVKHHIKRIDHIDNKYIVKDEQKFICEICKCATPYDCEGSYPNTCADCMPPESVGTHESNERGKGGIIYRVKQ